MKLEIVKWVDSSHGDEWRPIEDIVADELGYVVSVGWVAREDEEGLWLLPNVDSNGMGIVEMLIPKVAVLERREVLGREYEV